VSGFDVRSAVLWDIGGVLIHTDWASLASAWDPRLGLPPGGLLQALFGGCDDTVLVGRMSEKDWWDVVRRRLALDADGLRALRRDLRRVEPFDQDMLRVVRDLQPGVRQGVVSNAWGDTRRHLEAAGVDALFNTMVISAEVGVRKPGLEIFEIAIERLGVPASSCVLIDDVAENVDAAAALGVAGVLHRNAALTAARVQELVG
jgi:putative hydrolase of the HAD superfamily